MNRPNAAATPESNDFPNRFRRRWPLFPTCALFLMLMLLASRVAYATTYTVTDLTDSTTDTGSLRYAVNTAVDGDTIVFAPNLLGTIPLTGGALAINHSITITGPGPALLTISAAHNGNDVAFRVNSGTVNISGLTIADGNTVFPAGGGYVGGGLVNGATLHLSYCAVSDNVAGDGAGGILNQGVMTIDHCTIADNTAAGNVGGGIVNYGTMTVEDSTISGNATRSGNPGGGIENESMMPGQTLTIENSTIIGNTAGSGGGVDNAASPGSGTVTIANSIVADNTGGDCNQCGTQSANNMIGGTPNLGPLQYNGGDTKTMMPLPGSPAIGAGLSSTLATDQRGFVRPTGGASDLGAVQTNYLTVTTLADSTDTGTCTGGATCSLRDAIAAANSAGSGDIVFQSGLTGMITLGSALPSITANTNLLGPGANRLTISGPQPASGNFLVLNIPNTTTAVNLRGVTITGGTAQSSGPGGVSNNGRLSVENSSFSYNTGETGGAIFNTGVLGVEDSTFSNNIAANGGGIDNSGSLVVANSTFTGNRDYNSNGGGIANTGGALVYDSTVAGNNSLNGGVGAGMYNGGSGSLVVTNSIVAANINLNGNTEDDCHNCTQVGPMLTGANPGLGALAYNGLNATVQTMLPLPGSPAIQAGDATLLPPGNTTDERGFPRLTGGKLDVGAAQTNYTAVQFVQQPSNTALNAAMSPAVTLEVLETNTSLSAPNNTDAVDGIPIALTLNGPGILGGTLTQTTSGGVASFGNLTVNTAGTGDTLETSLTVTPTGVTPAQTLTVTSSPFDIAAPTAQIITFTAPPANVTYGVSPITLSATSSASLPVTFQVDSGPATLAGNILTITGAGTVVVEADAAGNTTYAAAAPVTKTILVAQATSQLALTASATQANLGSSVTLTATATSATPGATATPTGTVTFKTGTMTLGTATLNAQGVATLAVTTLPVGSNTITASYPGDTNFLGTTGQLAGTIDIKLQTQTITFTAPPANVTYGVSPISLSATSSAGLPVTFKVDSGSAMVAGNILTITGAGTVVVEADAAGNATYAAATPVTKTILVAQAASQLALIASATQANPGSSVTLTATATSSAGVPTGTVTFKAGTMTLGTATLNAQGVATLAVTTLPAGSNTVTASYPGDTNFLGSNAQLAGTIIIGTPGFTMSSIPGFSISPGQQQQVVFTLTPTFGYTGTVTFACSNLPTQSQCVFAPTSVTFNGSGSAIQVNLTMIIGAPKSSLRKNTAKLLPWKPLGGLPVIPAMFFWLPGTENLLEERYGHKQAIRTKSRSKSARMLLMVAVLALSAGFLALAGCGGHTPFVGPAPGQQTVTITATGSGGITQSVPVQVTIQ